VTAPEQRVEIPPGLIALTTFGLVTGETLQALVELQRYNFERGLKNIGFATISGSLVDKARNEAAIQMLSNPNLRYLLFIDADMTFRPDLVEMLIMTAFTNGWEDARKQVHGGTPWADIVGAWCPLRGKPYLPTIDTGSGTWEPTAAYDGPKEVIRTGSAAVLIKRHVFDAMEFPWYGVRPAPRPIDMLLEVDNFARCKNDGQNPLRDHPFWATLEKCAKEDAAAQRTRGLNHPAQVMSSVGEDSSFCDRAKALGFRIVVQTDAVAEHLERRPITPDDHYAAMRETERWSRLAVGITS
jgi:hypothetical protein